MVRGSIWSADKPQPMIHVSAMMARRKNHRVRDGCKCL